MIFTSGFIKNITFAAQLLAEDLAYQLLSQLNSSCLIEVKLI